MTEQEGSGNADVFHTVSIDTYVKEQGIGSLDLILLWRVMSISFFKAPREITSLPCAIATPM
ncbi:hypothetical protein [Paenibacillus sp. BK720]|uniref:hypothetical protein n=1 Tax=Paenibacillus sp. BK720 TaxID=2587092 RepID=UPI001422053A|nr:hypothetical protein [Paenibacillus sp. BK720]NIK70141.1 hypothetical protein [Paenibacillus sp. BK720]